MAICKAQLVGHSDGICFVKISFQGFIFQFKKQHYKNKNSHVNHKLNLNVRL